MASLQYFNDPGAGQIHGDFAHYSQVVRIPGTPIVKCSGQGGWNPQNAVVDADDFKGQVELAFQNVALVLKTAGLRGWEDVYLVRSYHVGMDDTFLHTIEMLKKWCPNHRPLWTCVAVPRLAEPEMKIEIDVEAYEPAK